MEQQADYNTEKARKDTALLRKYAAIQKASEEKIGCQRIYVDMTGDWEAALVLDEIIFFTLPRKDTGKSGLRIWKNGYLWMAVRRAEWWERKRLLPRQADTAIDKLESQGLIVKEIHRFNNLPSTHLRLNVDVFFRLYFECLEKENLHEDETESIAKDLDDLYEMMGMESQSPNCHLQNGDGKLQNGDSKLQNGDSINNPHTSRTQPPLGEGENLEPTKPADPRFPDWNMLHGLPVTEQTPEEQFNAQARDGANHIATGKPALFGYAMAFILETRLIPTTNQVKKWRKQMLEWLEYKPQPTPAHVIRAVREMKSKGLGIPRPSSLYNLQTLASTPVREDPPTVQEEPREMPKADDLNAVRPDFLKKGRSHA